MTKEGATKASEAGGAEGTWKTAVFPILDGAENNESKVSLSYSETEDVLLPEDYKPTKCESSQCYLNGKLR